MKLSAAVCFAFVLAGPASLAAQEQPAGTSAATQPATSADQPTGNTSPAPAASADAPAPKKVQKKKTAAAKSPKIGVAKTRQPETGEQPRSGAAIVKQGGQTCSGLDQYRVCW